MKSLSPVFLKAFALGFVFAFVLLASVSRYFSPLNGYISSVYHSTNGIPMEDFPEPAWRTPSTLAVTTVASTPFARFEIHKVKTESGAIVNDWLWTDERSHVNILVHLKKENRYLLFHQMKYGLEKPYYAAIGGLFNPGDTPLGCAKRELLEETGLEAKQWVGLGRYRVQVNRGGGILYAFLAKNCVPSKNKKASDDYEKQVHKKVTRDELISLSLGGEIGEAQWVATVALGIVYEEHVEHHNNSISSHVLN
jgi:ADP-ribose pyrophosphatase